MSYVPQTVWVNGYMPTWSKPENISEENQAEVAISYIRQSKKCTAKHVGESLGLSLDEAQSVCDDLVAIGAVFAQKLRVPGSNYLVNHYSTEAFPPKLKYGEIQSLILEYVRKNPDVTAVQVSTGLKLKLDTARKSLAALMKKKLLLADNRKVNYYDKANFYSVVK